MLCQDGLERAWLVSDADSLSFGGGRAAGPSLFRKPAVQELFEGAVVNGFGQVLDALLVAPGIIDHEPALPFTEVDVRVVQVYRIGDSRALGIA